MRDLSHKNLDVYKVAMQLLGEIFSITNKFPAEERYALIIQIRRAAISVCSNIAESASRISKKEKKRFYEIAKSSLVEIDTQFEIAIILTYLTKDKISTLEKYLESTFKMLNKMISNLKGTKELAESPLPATRQSPLAPSSTKNPKP